MRKFENLKTGRTIDGPEWDKQKFAPVAKLPDCPRCGNDELGMVREDAIFCHYCGEYYFIKEEEKNHE